MFFYYFFIYVLTLEIWLSRREGWDPIHCFTPKDQNCQQQHMSWSFLCQR